MTQQLKSKAWADIVESLIGLIYLETGEQAAMEFLVYLGIIPEVPQGFEREHPTVHITEVNMALEDDQLAAEIAAVETAAASMDVNAGAAVQAGGTTAEPAGDAAAKPAVDMAAVAAGDAACEPAADSARGTAAKPANDADVAMTDAIESAGAAQGTGLIDDAEDAVATLTAAAAAAAPAAAPASATAELRQAATDAISGHHSKSADNNTAPSADSSARDSRTESDMVVDNSGYGHTSSYHNAAPLNRLHPAQPNGGQASSVHASGVQDRMPESSVPSANGRGASAAVRPHAETPDGKPAPDSNASSSRHFAADRYQAHANGHVGVVMRQAGNVAGLVDPNAIDIGDGEDKLQHDGHHLQAEVPQPKQEPRQGIIQSGYLSQSGYGHIELRESDSEQSDSANPEEISIAEPGEELYVPVPPSPSRPVQPMDTDPPASPAPAKANATAPELANGAAPVPGRNCAAPTQPSGEPVKIKIEPGLEAGGAAAPDQNQIETDALAFLAMNDDDSEDEVPQVRPRRGQVSFRSRVLPSLAASSYNTLRDMTWNTSMCHVRHFHSSPSAHPSRLGVQCQVCSKQHCDAAFTAASAASPASAASASMHCS